MSKLAICIPNYNRPNCLERLLKELAEQIDKGNLYNEVEICVNDDCSPEKPDQVIDDIKTYYPGLALQYCENDINRGMDYNFLQCVMISEGEYCWIVGNDDLPEKEAVSKILNYIASYPDMDLLVSPFYNYDKNNNIISLIEPIGNHETDVLRFDTSRKTEYDTLINLVNDGNAIFCFLSNVVFRRNAWVRHGDMFKDKMNSIFIQMYMNLQTLTEGAVYVYVPDKLIKNYDDAVVNETFKREYDVLTGLCGVLDYFFKGDIHKKLQKCIIDPRINGRMWSVPDDSPIKEPILNIDSDKNKLYRKFFIKPEERRNFFKDKYILLYGAGNLGKKAVAELTGYHFNNLKIFDADETKWGKDIQGYRIYPVDDLFTEYDRRECVVVVANSFSLAEIITTLQNRGIKKFAIIN